MQHRLIWFRDDLRLDDNAAVTAALDAPPDCQIRAVFLTADREWAEFGYGANRLYYTEVLLRSLAARLADRGITFQIVALADYADQAQWMLAHCVSQGVTDLYWNHEYQINERRRDQAIKTSLTHTRVHEFMDRVVLQPGSVLTGEGKYYGVFTPFKKRWLQTLQTTHYGSFATPSRTRAPVSVANWAPLAAAPESDLSGFASTEADAQSRLEEFIAEGLGRYQATRNAPAVTGTSRLSPYLARGLLSPRQCIHAAEAHFNRPIWDLPDDAFAWINELIWREFYHHLLIGFPRLSKDRAFRSETEAVAWRNEPDQIKAWQTGQTGIPIVDAGMRELLGCGWMHNRVRMIVAQFLTKNLLVDWRVGERHFMRYLIDSDLAANNGGWQWSASTGTDAAPYFRVFNPLSQGQTHDPEGAYIARWVPELAPLPAKQRHLPDAALRAVRYPVPIVDLKTSRQRAIDVFKELTK